MIIVFDMDNTLIDELGSGIRPGVINLLQSLKADKHELKLWTNSKKVRAKLILKELSLENYFSEFIFRENYDPEDKGIRKDIRKVKGDYLIDDDPKEIQFVKSIGKDGFLISSYRKGKKLEVSELDKIYNLIQRKKGFFRKIFK